MILLWRDNWASLNLSLRIINIVLAAIVSVRVKDTLILLPIDSSQLRVLLVADYSPVEPMLIHIDVIIDLVLNTRILLLLLLVLKLSYKTVATGAHLSSLVSSLALAHNILFIDDWHIFERWDVISLHNKHCASYFDNVIDLQRMQRADLSLGTESEPSSICWSNILEVKALLLATTLRATWAVCNLCMEIAHLRVFLNVESIVHISSNTKTKVVHSNHPISRRSFEDMSLDNIIFASCHDSELTQPHLEHHIFFQKYLLPDHYESSSGRAYVSQVELDDLIHSIIVSIAFILIVVLS